MSEENLSFYKEIGFNILRYRRIKGLRQEELARLAGISRTRLSHIENGNVDFTLSVLIKLARTLEINVEQLLLRRFD